MAHSDQLKILKSGVSKWNQWREKNKAVEIDLRGDDLKGLNLCGFNLSKANLGNADFTDAILIGVNLTESNLSNTDLINADLRSADLEMAILDDACLIGCNLSNAYLNQTHLCGANLRGANLTDAILCYAEIGEANLVGADLNRANLSGADLSNADLSMVNLYEANLSGANLIETCLNKANLSQCDLTKAILIKTDLTEANLEGTRVYGISAWDIQTEGSTQKDLIITEEGELEITVDDLEIAQFIYLLLNNQKIRGVIETITSKAVLILGRFIEERKKVLDAIRDELRNRNFLPILFDFEKPGTRDLTETISILAKLSRFVIVDLTDAKAVPHELSHIIRDMPSLPVIPIIVQGQAVYGMFEHWRPYPWVLPIFEYESDEHLIENLAGGVIDPAERKVQEIRNK